METKKTERANLEGGKTLNFLMGMAVAMAALFVSFEWGTQDVQAMAYDGDGGIEWVDEIPITLPEQALPPPPPPQVVIAEALTVVDDDTDVDDVQLLTTEDTPDNPQTSTYLPPVTVEDEEEDENRIFSVAETEKMPVFPGGEGALLRFISQTVRYPVDAQENGIQGRVTATFVVNRDGSIVDTNILRGVYPSLDREALRVIKAMPPWEPGMQRGKPVRVKYTIPITFRLK